MTAPDGSERVVAVTQSPFCIGRAFHNDLPMIDPQISRHHACLRLEGGKIQLVDMGSENGTWIDGTRLEANQPYVLDYHETFRIGSFQMRPEPMAGVPLPTRSAEESVPIATTAYESTGVQATAGHSGPPLEPLVESGPGGGLGVLLKTPEISVTPGGSTNVSLVVINQNHGTDRFRITLSGIPDHWLPAPPPLIELPSNARQEVNLTVAPPRSPESRVGRYRPVIQVASQNVPTETVEVHPTLTVAPYSAFASRLNPPRIGANETAQVVVRNDGNAQQTFTVAWLDSEDRYEFRPPETQMTLAAGETAAVAFRVVPRRQRWFGGSRIDVYSAKITPEKGLPQAHTGQIVTAGIIPPWAAALLLVLLLCAIGSAAAAFALIGGAPTGTPTGTPTVTGTAAPTVTPLPTNTTLPPATPIPPTPIPPTPIPTSAPLPTYTPLPTNTPYPTNTPFPTAAPLPTSTPLPTSPPLPTSTPLAPTVTPTPNITDWRGEYYGNTDLQGAPLVVRNDTAINFNWGLGSPDPAVPIDNFSARWTRTLDFASGTYRFTVQADDGVRVFVDNNLIIDQWHSATLQTYTADVNLTAGSHALRVEYYEGILNAYIVFTFQLGS